jgi:hypothetical protein
MTPAGSSAFFERSRAFEVESKQALAGANSFSLWETVAGEAGRMRVRVVKADRKTRSDGCVVAHRLARAGASTLIRRLAPPSPGGRRGSAPEGRRLEGAAPPLARSSREERGRIAVERQRRDIAQVA